MIHNKQYTRVLIKLSGEALAAGTNNLYELNEINFILKQIKELVDLGIEVGIVIGGGNIFRGNNSLGIDVANAHYMGMLATVINGIALKDFMQNIAIDAEIFSAFTIGTVIKNFNIANVINAYKKKQVAIFVAGTGLPFVTTDTAAALRAIETKSDLIIKVTKVDGVYDKDPKAHTDAKKYDSLTFTEAINCNLQVLDIAAFSLCQTHKVNIVVCNINQKDALINIIKNKQIGTLIHS